MRRDKASMNYQRRMLAIYGFMLPILSVIFGFPAYEENGPEFWYSLSATFYATSGWILAWVLGVFSHFLWTYKGYDLGDDFTTKFSSVMATLILVFPCKTLAAGPTTGILNIPTDVSHIIHCIVAAFLFGSFAYMIGCRFTKHDSALVFTEGKRKRNNVYYVCAIIITLGMTAQFLTSMIGLSWFTIINETVMLWAFSFAWAVKSDVFKRWFDD